MLTMSFMCIAYCTVYTVYILYFIYLFMLNLYPISVIHKLYRIFILNTSPFKVAYYTSPIYIEYVYITVSAVYTLLISIRIRCLSPIYVEHIRTLYVQY